MLGLPSKAWVHVNQGLLETHSGHVQKFLLQILTAHRQSRTGPFDAEVGYNLAE